MKKISVDIVGIGEEFGCSNCFKSFSISFNSAVNIEWLESTINKAVVNREGHQDKLQHSLDCKGITQESGEVVVGKAESHRRKE